MNVKDAIEKRRSVRAYLDKDVPDALINELIDAARLAPSGSNAQPWAFKVVKDTGLRHKLREYKIFKQDFVYEVPVIIVCCTDPNVYPEAKLGQYDSPSETKAVRDLSIASQNLVLRATELGLGTCYVGLLKKQEIKKVLGIPKDYLVPFVITVGYPAEIPKPTPRKRIDELMI